MYVKESGAWLTKPPTLKDKLLLRRLNASKQEIEQQKWKLWSAITLLWLAAIIGPIVGAVALDGVSTFLQWMLIIFVILICVAGLVIFFARLMDSDPVITPAVEWLFFLNKREGRDFIAVDKAPAFASLNRVDRGDRYDDDGYYRSSSVQSWCAHNTAFADEINGFLADPFVIEVTRQLNEAPLSPTKDEQSVIAALDTRLDVRATIVINEIAQHKTQTRAKRSADRETWATNARAVADVTEASDAAADKFKKAS